MPGGELLGLCGGLECTHDPLGFLQYWPSLAAQLGHVLDVLLRPAVAIAGLAEDFALGGHEQHAGEPPDLVLVLEFVVALGVGNLGLGLVGAWEVEGHQDVLFAGGDEEGVVVENFFVELDAPATPVRAGEVHQEVLALFLGELGGDIEVGLPGFAQAGGAGRNSGESAEAECQGELFHG